MNNTDLFELLAASRKTTELIRKELKRRDISWKVLLQNGLEPDAVLQYRKQHDCLASEAFKAVREAAGK